MSCTTAFNEIVLPLILFWCSEVRVLRFRLLRSAYMDLLPLFVVLYTTCDFRFPSIQISEWVSTFFLVVKVIQIPRKFFGILAKFWLMSPLCWTEIIGLCFFVETFTWVMLFSNYVIYLPFENFHFNCVLCWTFSAQKQQISANFWVLLWSVLNTLAFCFKLIFTWFALHNFSSEISASVLFNAHSCVRNFALSCSSSFCKRNSKDFIHISDGITDDEAPMANPSG